MIHPTLEIEREFFRNGVMRIAGIDEVGRGALAGPVSVGAVLIDASFDSWPEGLADSKLISASKREQLVPRIEGWALSHAVGHASASEVDEFGIIGALRRAGLRALAALTLPPDLVILDGSHDWLTQVEDLFAQDSIEPTPPVHMRVKADQTCASVAAASVLAKVQRDAIMQSLDAQHPGYGFASNKGYGSEGHKQAIRDHGATAVHRVSWNLL